MCAEAVLPGEEVDDSFHGVGGGGLARVHPCADEHYWFLELEGSWGFLGEEFGVDLFFLSLIFVWRGDSEEVDRSLLGRVDENFLTEVELFI